MPAWLPLALPHRRAARLAERRRAPPPPGLLQALTARGCGRSGRWWTSTRRRWADCTSTSRAPTSAGRSFAPPPANFGSRAGRAPAGAGRDRRVPGGGTGLAGGARWGASAAWSLPKPVKASLSAPCFAASRRLASGGCVCVGEVCVPWALISDKTRQVPSLCTLSSRSGLCAPAAVHYHHRVGRVRVKYLASLRSQVAARAPRRKLSLHWTGDLVLTSGPWAPLFECLQHSPVSGASFTQGERPRRVG